MRLLELRDNGTFSLTKELINNIPPYAILSHTWGDDDEEVTFKDLTESSGKEKVGYRKIQFCAKRALSDSLQHIWVDTCCIDKSNNAELSEAIISMFRWYRNATKCYAYLADVSTNGQDPTDQSFQSLKPVFRKSRWFTRGWTLQELIAPLSVEFFSVEGKLLGDKRSLQRELHEITGIAVEAFQGTNLSPFSIKERMSWAKNRQTKREEDKAYSLLGMFNVHMPPLYGEGMESAFRRLREEIDKGSSSIQGDTKLVEIRRWLSQPDPSINYQKALSLRQSETGLWLLESELYSKWKRNVSSFVWLYGIPGCGKTILSSTVIQDIIHYCADNPGNVVAYFYFDFADVEKQKPEFMVRSLVSQLSEQCIKIPLAVEALYSSSGKPNRQPSLDVLMNVLQQILQKFPQSYLILDALDECADRAELMRILEQIAKWQLEKMHVLVTSRRERDIESSLEDIVNREYIVCLQSQVVDKDIQIYIRQRLSDDKCLKKWQKDAKVRREIETSLMEGSRGMFRWAVCQMDTLGKCRTRSALQRALKALPTTLDETYERILCKISDEDSEYAMRILQWLAFSSRPLSAEELAEVVAIDVERETAFDRDEILEDPMEVLDICLSLVSVVTTEVSSFRTVTLAHYSVQEYLVSTRICQGHAARYSMQPAACHGYIAKGSIGYLLQYEKGSFDRFKSAKSVQESCALAQYSAEHWIVHTHKAEEHDDRLSYLATKLLSTGDGAYLNWLRLYNPDTRQQKSNFRGKLDQYPNPLYYASLGGLAKTASRLVNKGANPNAQGGYHYSALRAASYGGHDKIVELLLSKGADVNAQEGYSTALQEASDRGHDKTVELLLSKGADVNAQGGYYRNALQAASAGGHDKIVELLLSKGADVNAQGGFYSNALYAASDRGHDKIVELLLSKGATSRRSRRYR